MAQDIRLGEGLAGSPVELPISPVQAVIAALGRLEKIRGEGERLLDQPLADIGPLGVCRLDEVHPELNCAGGAPF